MEVLINNNEQLRLEKDKFLKQIKNLKKTNEEKNELIKDIKDKIIHH